MTAWQRQAPGIANSAGTIANGAGSERACHFSWEDWFHRASASQRAEALALARQQGVVYFQQLAPAHNGSKPADSGPEAGLASVLARVLSNQADTLPFLPLDALTFFDPDLDEMQQQAVLRAMNTPDLFLMQGLPGTGKSRVTAEILMQAAARGWRVLFLATQPASLDVPLQRLAGCPEICAIRFLGPAEKADSLPVSIRSLTLEEQRKAFLKRVLAGARDHREQAETSCQKRREEGPLWPELDVCLTQIADLDGRVKETQERRTHLTAEVEREAQSSETASSLGTKLAGLQKALEQMLSECALAKQHTQNQLATVEQEAADLSRRIADLEPGYRAKKDKRYGTWIYWKHFFHGNLVQEMETLQGQNAGVQTGRQRLTEELAGLEERRRLAQVQHDTERLAAIAAEIECRDSALAQVVQALEETRRQCLDDWTRLSRRLSADHIEPAPAALAAAQEAWQRRRTSDEEVCRFAQQWTEFVEQKGPQFVARLPALANVLAGTFSAWQKDPTLQEALKGPEPFDLLVIEDAESLTETDLLRAARKAQRCVLVAHTCAETGPVPRSVEKTPRSFAAVPPISAVCWPRLWQTLGGDAGAATYIWAQENGRLSCQLLPLTKDDRPYLGSEGLADAAEIELRILHRPKTKPCLAQVVFPPHWSFQEAFSFIVREAQELPLQPLCRTGWWIEEPQRCIWQAAPPAAPIYSWIDLEAGIRLGTVADVGGERARLACIEFEKTAGWDRVKATAWLDRYRPARDHGRTMFLQTPHRFAAALAETLVTLVCADHWLTAAPAKCVDEEPSFEFCAVPTNANGVWPKDGAGLEADLSASRHADRLPSSLRQGLPARGYVNYLEAQALVRRLETLVRDREISAVHSPARIAVLALYQSQVELLRRLIEQSQVLQSQPVHLEVSLPSQMHQRECDLVLLSLTRSHSHRCVTFGDDVRELPIALTRARARLLVFGDIGMLCKRSHWHGPLDHLDSHSSQQEHLRLSRLLCCAQKQKEPLLVASAR